MAGTDPQEMLAEVAPEEVPATAPPPDAHYRAAEVQGVSCAHCVKFNYGGVIEEDDGIIPIGTCDLWEASVRGDYVSDGYAENSPPMDEQGSEDWNFVAGGPISLAAVHFAEPQQEEVDGFIKKTIMRTGTFAAIPTRAGLIRKPLHIVRDGMSDHKDGTIAMSELVQNFKANAIPNVQIPLSDDDDDHKNIAAVNTGFVRDIWIEDENGESKLIAKMEFTEPEVRDKVLRGTIADVSAGVPWRVRSRGKQYGACLEHVALTPKPFIDDLGPFLTASDERPDQIEVDHFGDGIERTVEESLKIPVEVQKHLAAIALTNQLNLSADYVVDGIEDGVATISHGIAEATWSVPFDVRDSNTVVLSPINEWKLAAENDDSNEESKESADEPTTPAVTLSGLDYARRLRRIRMEQGHKNTTRGEKMPLSQAELDRLELSDEQRAAFGGLLDENADLRAQTREAEVDQRVEELEGLGLKERPGALKLYRQVALADDGGPAAVLLSDKGNKESVTALEILDRFIDAIKGSDEKVTLSDQHLVKDDDPKPPDNADGEVEKPFDERLASAKAALGRTT